MLIIIFPLLGLFLSFFARYIGKKGAISLSIGSVLLSFLYAVYMGYTIIIQQNTYIYTWSWIKLENLDLNFTILLDPLSIIMCLLITFITSLVMIYSSSYLENDPSLVRFLSFFALFALCMLLMVTSGNYVQFFVGWEGVGLTSYLLISFWHTRNEANKGALKAVVVNRIGDVFFMLALGLMWLLFKSFDFSVIFHVLPESLHLIDIQIFGYNISGETLLAFCLLIAACAKSAQFLLHTWLPDAMEGPTPVSSLLHPATMVTAGVYPIIRSSFIFALTPKISFIMIILGVLTAVTAGLMGLSQYDLKRIIAYSTCSQLGFMVLACGLGYYNYALFHLITHAFFKCLLFLCSGSIIHALNDEQDIRKMGNLFYFLPITFACMTIGTLALTGFPFLAGYYSKDLILETAYASSSTGIFVFIFASFAAFLTSFYSIRSIYFVFFRRMSPIPKSSIENITESPHLMTAPMIILAIFAIFSGYILHSTFTGPINIWANSIATPIESSLLDHEYLPLYIKLVPTILGILGLIAGYLFFSTTAFYKFSLHSYIFSNLTTQKFYTDQLYNLFITKSTLIFGFVQYTIFDRGFLELLGPYGLTRLVIFFQRFAMLHNGFITHYILIFFAAIFLFFFTLFYVQISLLLYLILIICYFAI
jgi:NADH-quinone oxidoreductase subunit L